jgi:hypothetical protein
VLDRMLGNAFSQFISKEKNPSFLNAYIQQQVTVHIKTDCYATQNILPNLIFTVSIT